MICFYLSCKICIEQIHFEIFNVKGTKNLFKLVINKENIYELKNELTFYVV